MQEFILITAAALFFFVSVLMLIELVKDFI